MKDLNSFRGKKIAVIGSGTEGLSSAKFLKEKGADVTILDQNPHFAKASRGKLGKIITGKDYLKNLNQYDLIIRSPGIKPSFLKDVDQLKITSQTRLFFEECPCKIIGVTGTKGKSTTSSLIYEMLKSQDDNAYLGGNIGQPPLEFLNKLNTHPASPQGGSIVVLELSSFQLTDITKSPHIAVVLMTTSEHLDYHKDTYEYVEAKRNILRFQKPDDFAILNKDYPATRESDVLTKAKIFWVSRENEVEEGCFVKDGEIKVRYHFGSLPHVANDAQQTEFKNSKQTPSLSERRYQNSKDKQRQSASAFSSSVSGQPSDDEFVEEKIIKTSDILLPGKHNLENICAAVMAATLAGVSKENIVNILKTFKGLEHRLELVTEINGVKYYDDSFSTIPETAIAAIESFKNPEILILGGSSKNSDFSELGKVISNSKNVKAIIGIGSEWKRIKKSIKYNVSSIKYIEGLKTMKEIVQRAKEMAGPGDVVLLSPACASFDMFKNYKDRGDQFKKEVLRLKII